MNLGLTENWRLALVAVAAIMVIALVATSRGPSAPNSDDCLALYDRTQNTGYILEVSTALLCENHGYWPAPPGR